MNRHDIVALPHAGLRKKSTKVSKFDQNLKDFIQDMRDAALDWEVHRVHEFCVGLAASQVADNRRIIIMRDDLDDKTNTGFTALINPKVIKLSGGQELNHEGCLSVSDIYVELPRHKKVKIKAQDEDGKEIRITAEGFLARVLQHEVDHTNGIVIVDHAKDDPDAFYRIGSDGKTTKIDYETEVKDNHDLWD